MKFKLQSGQITPVPKLMLLSAVLIGICFIQTTYACCIADTTWITKSNNYTNKLIAVNLKYSPESGSAEGLSQYDKLISDPSEQTELKRRRETQEVLGFIKTTLKTEENKKVREDLQILENSITLGFRQEDFASSHKVPFINASQDVFQGLRVLLDDQTEAARRPAALERLKKYTGITVGFIPYTLLVEKRVEGQLKKPGTVYPSHEEIETALERDPAYLDGIAALFTKYKLKGWEADFSILKKQLTSYDSWLKKTILPNARTDFRLSKEEYALNLEGYGIDISANELAQLAHTAFTAYQREMSVLAESIVRKRHLPSGDYRDVILALKKEQITGEAILPFYKARLQAIEEIVTKNKIVSLPSRDAIIRIASTAETVQQPAPHMQPPPFMHNTGQRGEFVLPLNFPADKSGKEDKYDDFSHDAVAWTLTAHEARPGHELQFDSMLETGVSLARALYAFNSTNVEGWGLYSEYLIKPFMPEEGQLMSLDLRLLRAARAFIDPELQSGKLTTVDAYRILQHDVMLSHAFAKEEVERFTFNSPGQACSYFYGYSLLLQLRKDAEKEMGTRFNQLKFHDFLLAQGLLPPALMRAAVFAEYIGKN